MGIITTDSHLKRYFTPLYSQPLEVASRYRDPQLQAVENFSFVLAPNIDKF